MDDPAGGARSAPGIRAPELAGSRLDALATLTDRNRRARSAQVDKQLVRLRHDAYSDLPDARDELWPRPHADPFPELSGRAPEIAAAELDTDIMGGSIQHHGCLLVRGLFAPERAAQLIDDLDRAFAARDAASRGVPPGETGPWFVPFEPGPPSPPLWTEREWARQLGGILVADSPNALFDVIEALEAARVLQVVGEYLGEALALSANKCVLRRVSPDVRSSWHQDGAFLGGDIRTVDVWVALSHCGGDTDAPGLEIVPRRLERVVGTDEPDREVAYAVTSAQVARALDGLEPQMPTFAPGDALLFDHLLLHTTASRPGFKRERYALETWIFTPSTFPAGYVPLAL
jgi:hypothetical protein